MAYDFVRPTTLTSLLNKRGGWLYAKRIITLLMIIAGASLGISLFPMAWEMANKAITVG